jgi:hypothetical protein
LGIKNSIPILEVGVFRERPIKKYFDKSFLGEAVWERLVRRKSWPLG